MKKTILLSSIACAIMSSYSTASNHPNSVISTIENNSLSISAKNDGNDLILPNGYRFIDAYIANGAWSKYIQLPKSPKIGDIVKINRTSAWDTFVLLNSHSMLIPKHSITDFIYNGIDWIARYPNAIHKESTFFNENAITDDLSGDLNGSVLFAQAHIIPPRINEHEKQMHLVGERKTKVMFKPSHEIHYNSKVIVTAIDKDDKILGSINMKNPSQLAPNVLSMPELTTTNIDFSYDESKAFNVSTPTTEAITAALVDHDTVIMRTWNGHWNSVFDLEQDNPKLDGKTFVFISSAGYNSHVNYYKDRSHTIENGTTTVFKNVKGAWILQSDLIFNEIGYAKGYWSANLPKEWLKPGLALTFASGDKKGTLNNIKVGAPTELLIHTIDIGMLVEPRGRFDFQKDKEAQREYFETVPISKMIVSEYEPVHLTEVMLPDGTLLTDHDPSDGGWHSGTMRQSVGKELISIGINNANYGIYSTSGVGEEENPYISAQLTGHNSRGMYNNGLQTHGGSGGAGIITLDSSIGNEFSHEVGHNYGLGHYPGGFAGSIHRPADMPNSTWGWDSSRDVFIPNFSPINTGGESCLDGQCVPSFKGMFKYGSDSMAGGLSMYGAQRFTLYTPYSMYFIQKNLESKVVFDKTSSTGFRKWDEATQTMVEYTHRIEDMEATTVNPWDANEIKIAALFENFDKVDLSTRDGHWARNMSVPAASEANKNKVFTFNSDASYQSWLNINGEDILVPHGSRLTFVSDSKTWIKGIPLSSISNMNTTSIAPWDANKTKIAALFDNFDKVDLSTWDGHWVKNMSIPTASEANKGKVFTFNSDASYNSWLNINGNDTLVPYGSRLTFISDGQTWIKNMPFERTKAVKPDRFGVPVTTLVGYYDPEAKLDSYIFPALHGSFGYVYSDDSTDLIVAQCYLEVETQSGSVLKYALKNNRRNADNMNKFHVNVATSDNPVSASVVCSGQVLDTRAIDAPKLEPAYTIQGGDQVILYTDANYQGSSITTTGSMPWIGDDFNDQLSSIKIPNGWKVTLYEDANYKGRSITLTNNDDWLNDFNDLTSSIRIEEK